MLSSRPRNYPQCHLAAPRLIARRALDPFFSNWVFWGNKRHRDWQLRRVRIGRVISNKCHKTVKLMSCLQGSRPSSLREPASPLPIILLDEHERHRILIFARIHVRECVVIYCHCSWSIGSIIPVVLFELEDKNQIRGKRNHWRSFVRKWDYSDNSKSWIVKIFINLA